MFGVTPGGARERGVGADDLAAALPHDRERVADGVEAGAPLLRGADERLRARRELAVEVAVEPLELRVPLAEERLEPRVLLDDPELVDGALDGDEEVPVVPGLPDEAEDLGAVHRLLDRARVRLAGEEDALDARPALLHHAQELDAGHARHPVVGDDHLDRLLLEQGERARCVGRVEDAAAGAAEDPPQRAADVVVVVDDEQRRLGRRLGQLRPSARLQLTMGPGGRCIA